MNTETVATAVAKNAPQVYPVSKAIHDHPELGFKEHEASKLQVALLRQAGFFVATPCGSLDTAYRAEYGSGGPVFAILSEYDALPEIGHACGHNLICAAALAGALALRDLMEQYRIPGTLAVIGTPAEETLGGKIIMLNHGVFKDIDGMILSHPGSANALDPGDLAVSRFDVTFKGKAAHAAAAPHQGINALDAMNLMFAGISCWRQQLPPGGMVHGIISHGGTAPNIIPEHTEAFFYLRSHDNDTQKIMEQRFREIARGAAIMTGTEFEVVQRPYPYSADKPNPPLRQAAFEAMEELGLNPIKDYDFNISTDYADVSLVVPGVNFFFDITGGRPVALHSAEFEEIAGTEAAFQCAMNAAKIIARTGLRFFSDAEFRAKVTA